MPEKIAFPHYGGIMIKALFASLLNLITIKLKKRCKEKLLTKEKMMLVLTFAINVLINLIITSQGPLLV